MLYTFPKTGNAVSCETIISRWENHSCRKGHSNSDIFMKKTDLPESWYTRQQGKFYCDLCILYPKYNSDNKFATSHDGSLEEDYFHCCYSRRETGCLILMTIFGNQTSLNGYKNNTKVKKKRKKNSKICFTTLSWTIFKQHIDIQRWQILTASG